MIVMNKKTRAELDRLMKVHASAAFEWGANREADDLRKVKAAWKELNDFIDKPHEVEDDVGIA